MRQLLAGVPIRVVAVNHDTSIAMLERTYTRHIGDFSDALARGALLDMTEPAVADLVERAILARATPCADSQDRTSFVCDLPPTTVDTLIGLRWLPAERATPETSPRSGPPFDALPAQRSAWRGAGARSTEYPEKLSSPPTRGSRRGVTRNRSLGG